MIRNISFSDALSEGLVQAMDKDISIFVTGIGVDYASGVFGTTKDAFKKFGKARVFESPAMENAITGICIGAAASGSRPLLVHYRNDFLLLSLDQLMNLAAKWNYMYGGNAPTVPVVIRAIIGRGWGQGATHSQSLQSVLAHFPGVAVVMPTFPEDAKGLLLSAFESKSPVVLLEHRSLFDLQGNVPLEPTKTPIGKAKVIRQGTDVTIVSFGKIIKLAYIAAEELAKDGISVEIIDLRTVRPIDYEAIVESVKKTNRLIILEEAC
jgi:pyruvate dehydrogenase E1 component beta subunit